MRPRLFLAFLFLLALTIGCEIDSTKGPNSPMTDADVRKLIDDYNRYHMSKYHSPLAGQQSDRPASVREQPPGSGVTAIPYPTNTVVMPPTETPVPTPTVRPTLVLPAGPTSELVPTVAPTSTPLPTATKAPTSIPVPTSPSEVVEFSREGIVSITADASSGSGFIFDQTEETGFVVTSHHVIDGSSKLDVQVANQTYKGVLLGYDSDKDVAVLSICCNSAFRVLAWESFSTAEVGERVVAVGNPRDDLTATTGLVVEDVYGGLFGYIAHDAPIHKGSSGGPLFAMNGEVLGIHVGQSTFTPGVHYAVPYSDISDQIAQWKTRLVPSVPSTPVPGPGQFTEEECEAFTAVMFLAAQQDYTAQELYQLFEESGISRRQADALANECLGDLVK